MAMHVEFGQRLADQIHAARLNWAIKIPTNVPALAATPVRAICRDDNVVAPATANHPARYAWAKNSIMITQGMTNALAPAMVTNTTVGAKFNLLGTTDAQLRRVRRRRPAVIPVPADWRIAVRRGQFELDRARQRESVIVVG
jgi:hypothetical protein